MGGLLRKVSVSASSAFASSNKACCTFSAMAFALPSSAVTLLQPIGRLTIPALRHQINGFSRAAAAQLSPCWHAAMREQLLLHLILRFRGPWLRLCGRLRPRYICRPAALPCAERFRHALLLCQRTHFVCFGGGVFFKGCPLQHEILKNFAQALCHSDSCCGFLFSFVCLLNLLVRIPDGLAVGRNLSCSHWTNCCLALLWSTPPTLFEVPDDGLVLGFFVSGAVF